MRLLLPILILFSNTQLEAPLSKASDEVSLKQIASAWVKKFGKGETANDTQKQVAVKIIRASYKVGVPPVEALRRGWEESRWTMTARRDNGPGRGVDRGPLQVNDRWTPEVRRQTAEQSIYTGLGILKKYYDSCGKRWVCAHRAYRTGVVQ
jgi:soluble lytic murein transglycosylase-like protein